VQGVFLHKSDRLLDGAHGKRADLGDAALVGAREAAGLDPGIGKVSLALLAEEDHAAHRRHLAAPMVRYEAQGLEIAAGELAHGRERLGGRSEVGGFRVEPGHRLLVESFTPHEAAQLLDQLGVGSPVGGAHPDIDATGRSFSLEVVRTARAGMDLHCQYLRATPEIRVFAAPREDLFEGPKDRRAGLSRPAKPSRVRRGARLVSATGVDKDGALRE